MSLPQKNSTNGQWGRVALDGDDTDPASQELATASNLAKAPLVDKVGRLWVRIVGGVNPVGTPSTFNLQGDAATVVKATPGSLLYVFVMAAEKSYFQIFDKTTVPVAADIPIYSLRVEKEMNAVIDIQTLGDPFANGISVGWSSMPEDFQTPPGGAVANYRARVLYR